METQAEGEAGSTQGAPCGTRSWDSRITPWAEGRNSTTEPPRCPKKVYLKAKGAAKRAGFEGPTGGTKWQKGLKAQHRHLFCPWRCVGAGSSISSVSKQTEVQRRESMSPSTPQDWVTLLAVSVLTCSHSLPSWKFQSTGETFIPEPRQLNCG